MKYWQLIAKNSLKLFETSGKKPEGKEIRVKISKILLTRTDNLIYNGTINAPYPFTMGSYAIGKVSEGYGVDMTGEGSTIEFAYKRNERVLLRTFSADEDNNYIAGINAPGLLKDYAYVTAENLFHIPSVISDDEALLLGLVAYAEAVIDRLKTEEGRFVAVSGEDILSVILCQLLLYYKHIPVLITSSTEKAAFAKKCGIFYSLTTGEELRENIFRITGGRYCDAAVYINTMNKVSPAIILGLVNKDAHVVFAGMCDKVWSMDSSAITQKNLVVVGVNSGYGYERSAINIIANKAIHFFDFEKNYTDFMYAPNVFEKFAAPETAPYPLEIITVS